MPLVVPSLQIHAFYMEPLYMTLTSQNSHRLFAMLVLSPSFVTDLTLQPKLEVKFKISMSSICLYHIYGTKCAEN